MKFPRISFGTTLLALFLCISAHAQLDFRDPINIPDQNIPLGMTIADFDNNKLSDIAYTTNVTGGNGGLVVMLNMGNNVFSTQIISGFSGTSSVYPIASGDLNKDGREDIVIFDNGESSNGKIVVVSYNGTSFTTTRHDVSIFISKDIEVIDFNLDGNLDIVCASDSGPIQILEGSGTGSFTTTTLSSVDAGFTNIGISDLNMDGKLDIVGGTYTNELVTYIANGSSYLEKRYPVASQVMYVVTKDFSGDNVPDVVVSLFGTTVLYHFLNDGSGKLISSSIGISKTPWNGMDVGDYNNDGREDLVVGSLNSGGVMLMTNQGSGNFSETTILNNQSENIQDIRFADLDANGTLEIIALSGFKRLDIYSWNGANFDISKNIILGTLPSNGLVVDLNTDGNMDLISMSVLSHVISVYYGDGSGTFNTRHDYLVKGELGAITSGDFNSDGFPDIAFSTHPSTPFSQTALILSTSNGTLSDLFTDIAALSSRCLKAAQINNDSKLDLISTNTIYKGNGNATFTPVSFTPVINVFFIDTGDLDGDGNLDLLVSDLNTNLKYSINSGAGDFNSFQTVPTTTVLYDVKLAYVNNDSKVDFVIADIYDQSVTIITTGNSGQFSSKTIPIGAGLQS